MSANQLVDEMPGIGHNQPPIDELLAPFRERQVAVIEVAKTALIVDRESARKVLDLEQTIQALDKELEEERERRKRPYLDICRQIDETFGAITGPLRTVRYGENGRGGLRGMLTTWDREERERVQAERERREAEARRAEAEAEAARRIADQGRVNGGNITAELAAIQAEETARRLAQQAATVVAEPLRSNLGQLSVRREITFTIVDLRKLLGWMLRQHGLKAQVEQAARTIMGKYLRGLGVQNVERGIEIPGVVAGTERVATVRS